MSLSRHIRLFRPLAVLLALSVAVFSCKEPVKIEPAVPPVLTVKTQTVEGEAGSQFITISATGDWTISTSASWLTVNPSSGSGNNNMVVLSYSENTDAVRTASVTVTGAGGYTSASLTQNKLIVPEPPTRRMAMASRQPMRPGLSFRKLLKATDWSSSRTI